MEFRMAQGDDTQAVKDLWSYCFEPADHPFFIYYFDQAYEPEHTMVGYDYGQLVSTVHLRQYTLRVRGAKLPVSYMVAVATHPVARRGGIGGTLLRSALEELRARKQGLTILMPSKAAFYQQYGWELYCHQWVQSMDLESLRPLTDRTLEFGLLTSEKDWKRLSGVYDGYTKDLSGYALRGKKEWTRLLGSWFAEGVKVAYVKNSTGQLEGYCAYRLGEPEIAVPELVYTTRRAQKGLLNYLYNHRSQGSSIRWNEGLHDESYLFHPDGKEGHSTMPFMMSRVVDVKIAMESIPVPEALQGTIQFGVRDELCPWNHGTYQAVYKQGTVKVKKLKDHVDVNAPLVFAVGGLALLLMGRLTATELAFEGKVEGPEDVLALLNRAYGKQKTYINEWW